MFSLLEFILNFPFHCLVKTAASSEVRTRKKSVKVGLFKSLSAKTHGIVHILPQLDEMGNLK